MLFAREIRLHFHHQEFKVERKSLNGCFSQAKSENRKKSVFKDYFGLVEI